MITPEGIGLKQSIYIALKVHRDWWSLVPSTLLWTPHQLLDQEHPIKRWKHFVILKLLQDRPWEGCPQYRWNQPMVVDGIYFKALSNNTIYL